MAELKPCRDFVHKESRTEAQLNCEFRPCGGVWVYCSGNCSSCVMPKTWASSNTQTTGGSINGN